MNKNPDHMLLTIRNCIPLLMILLLLQTGCAQNKNSKSTALAHGQNNVLEQLTDENLGEFKWLNEPRSFEIKEGALKIVAEKETDFFNNPEDKKKTATAPILYKELQGDFVAKALVRPDFSSLWNAVALMVHIDNDHWIKFAFENSDATGKSIVSVVTKEISDDANGAILKDQDQIWLKVVRKDNNYSMLWSKDGNDFKMARLSTLPDVDSVKIGIEAQSPVGEAATHEIIYFEITKTTVNDLRKGE